MKNARQNENGREGLIQRVVRRLAWSENRQHEHQLEYGARNWAADVTETVSSFPKYSRRAKDFFGKFDELLFNSGLGSWGVYSGHRFTKTFDVSTGYGNHQMETRAFFHRQEKQPCEPELGDQVTHWIIREHRDEPNVEVTLRALMQSDDDNPSRERAWEFMLGLNYEGNDRDFAPIEVGAPSLREVFNYRLRGVSLDNRSRTEKMPLLLQSYGATIRQRGIQLLDERVAETAAELEIEDERLKLYAEQMFTLINAMERNCDRGEKPEVVKIINRYKSEAERFGELAREAERSGNIALAAEHLLQREKQIGTAEHIVSWFIDQQYEHRHTRSYDDTKREKRHLGKLFEQAEQPEMAEWVSTTTSHRSPIFAAGSL
ncbi:hypothetical protein HY450_03935 [Candidatus Pacearchaeota archaeon]|nr:hypothetical protein [Candidatus Pacearchaeota archaeon]